MAAPLHPCPSNTVSSAGRQLAGHHAEAGAEGGQLTPQGIAEPLEANAKLDQGDAEAAAGAARSGILVDRPAAKLLQQQQASLDVGDPRHQNVHVDRSQVLGDRDGRRPVAASRR